MWKNKGTGEQSEKCWRKKIRNQSLVLASLALPNEEGREKAHSRKTFSHRGNFFLYVIVKIVSSIAEAASF